MIKSLKACWIDESPQWNLVCFQVVPSSDLYMHCNELNLHFLKTVYAAHHLLSHKENTETVVVLSHSLVLSNCFIYYKHDHDILSANIVTVSCKVIVNLCQPADEAAHQLLTKISLVLGLHPSQKVNVAFKFQSK